MKGFKCNHVRETPFLDVVREFVVSIIQRAMSAGASASVRETVHSLMW